MNEESNFKKPNERFYEKSILFGDVPKELRPIAALLFFKNDKSRGIREFGEGVTENNSICFENDAFQISNIARAWV